MELYNYISRDLLKYPEKYEFSMFQGKDFLKEYENSRIECINYLKNKGTETVSFMPLTNQFKTFEEWYFNLEEEIDTTNLLEGLLYYSLNNHKKENSSIYKILCKFVKKYEVFKKIYDKYDKDLRKKGDDSNNLENYALLSLNSIHYYIKSHNLKFLNITLKLNDLLCSKKDELNSPLEVLSSLESLELEKQMIHDLFDLNGVHLK